MENHYFNRRYIFKGSIFHCYVSLPECILSRISSHVWQPQQNSRYTAVHRVHTVYIITPNSISAIYHPTSFLRPTGTSIPEMLVPDIWVFVKYIPRILPNKSLEKSNKIQLFCSSVPYKLPQVIFSNLSGGHGGDPCLPFPMGEIQVWHIKFSRTVPPPPRDR